MKRAAALIVGAALVATLGLMAGRAAAQCCGDCTGDGAVTVDELVTSVNPALGSCADDGICSMESCPAQLATCRDELADCQAQPGPQRLPASGLRRPRNRGRTLSVASWPGRLHPGAALTSITDVREPARSASTSFCW